jgi:Zn-dependent metalloprotease
MSNIKDVCLLSLLVLFGSQSLKGQLFKSVDAEKIVKGSNLVRVNPKNSSLQYIKLKDETKVEDKDRGIWLGKTLNISQKHTLKEVSRITDKLGTSHYKYQVRYKNLPVEGEIYTIHSKAGRVSSANGDFTSGNEISEIPGLTEIAAFNIALESVHSTSYKWEVEKSARPIGELVILPLGEKYFLTYKFDIYSLNPLSRQYIFVDANSGKIIKTINRIQDENVVGTAETMYNGNVNITTDFYSGHYRLREVGRGNGIETFDLKNGTDASLAT